MIQSRQALAVRFVSRAHRRARWASSSRCYAVQPSVEAVLAQARSALATDLDGRTEVGSLQLPRTYTMPLSPAMHYHTQQYMASKPAALPSCLSPPQTLPFDGLQRHVTGLGRHLGLSTQWQISWSSDGSFACTHDTAEMRFVLCLCLPLRFLVDSSSKAITSSSRAL